MNKENLSSFDTRSETANDRLRSSNQAATH